MSRTIAADLSASSSLKRAEAVAAIKARASLIAGFKNGEYKLYTPETGRADTDFATMFSFTRATVATVDTYAGVADIASGQPRFSAGKGLRIEESRENLLTYSEEFDNADWLKTNSTISADSENAPDNSVTADELVEDSSNGVHQARQTYSVTSGVQYSFSIYAKQNTRTQVALVSTINSNDTDVFVDLKNGVVISAGVDVDSFSVEAASNGFYRITQVVTADSTGSALLVIRTASDNTDNYQGDGTSGIYIWGAQLEERSFVTSYIPTAASSVVRDNDIVSRAISNEYNQNGWTIWCKRTFLDAGANRGTYGRNGGLFFRLYNAESTFTNQIVLFTYLGEVWYSFRDADGSGYDDANTTTEIPYDEEKAVPVAITVKPGVGVTVCVGGQIFNQIEANIPKFNATELEISRAYNGESINSNYEEFLYIPEILTDDELKTLTEPD